MFAKFRTRKKSGLNKIINLMRYFKQLREPCFIDGFPFPINTYMKEGYIMFHLPIGTIQTATVLREIETGYVLQKETDEVLLHHNETDGELEVDENVEVFLYNDKNNQIVATMILPTITRDSYDWAEVVEVIPRLGAFVNIGIAKDILVSIDDLPLFEDVWPQTGDQLYVTLGLDQEDRLLALPATESVFFNMREIADDELFNKEISGYVYRTSREGTAFFSEDGYRGFIHHTERDVEPRLGEFIKGRIIAVKDDGTVNVSLKPLKQDRMADDANTILTYLESHDGVIPFGNKSDPEDIRATFNMSKSAFKRALGKLLKENKIKPGDNETTLHK